MLQYAYRRDAPVVRSAARARSPEWATYTSIEERPRITWPDNARVALWVCPNILYYEFTPPVDPWIDPWARMPAPDVLGYGRQEYGSRVGFWRMLEVLDKHSARCTAIVNSEALQKFPAIRDAAVARNWDYAGHGHFNTRFTIGMSPEEELEYYVALVRQVEELTGIRMQGMGGPGPQSATENTPEILARAGLSYYTDLFFDDQPVPLRTSAGRLISLPYTIEINDPPFLGSAFEADQFADAIKRQFDVLYEEGEHSGRVMCISLHGHLFGQPQRVRYLDAALRYVHSFPGVWHATGCEIASHYLAHHFDAAVQYANSLSPLGND